MSTTLEFIKKLIPKEKGLWDIAEVSQFDLTLIQIMNEKQFKYLASSKKLIIIKDKSFYILSKDAIQLQNEDKKKSAGNSYYFVTTVDEEDDSGLNGSKKEIIIARKIKSKRPINKDFDFYKNLLKVIRHTHTTSKDLRERCLSLSVLAAAFYLNPKHFETYSDSEKEILANPLKRLEYLSGKKVQGEHLREVLNSQESIEIKEDNILGYQSYLDITFKENWGITRIDFSCSNYYQLDENFTEETLALHADHDDSGFISHINSLINRNVRKLCKPEKDEDEIDFGF